MSTKQYLKGHAVSLGLVFVLLAASAFVAWDDFHWLLSPRSIVPGGKKNSIS